MSNNTCESTQPLPQCVSGDQALAVGLAALQESIATSKPVCLFSLPRELRDKIYRYLLLFNGIRPFTRLYDPALGLQDHSSWPGQMWINCLARPGDLPEENQRMWLFAHTRDFLGVFSACKQLHNECSEIFWQNVFIQPDSYRLYHFISRLSDKQRSLIRKVGLVCHHRQNLEKHKAIAETWPNRRSLPSDISGMSYGAECPLDATIEMLDVARELFLPKEYHRREPGPNDKVVHQEIDSAGASDFHALNVPQSVRPPGDALSEDSKITDATAVDDYCAGTATALDLLGDSIRTTNAERQNSQWRVAFEDVSHADQAGAPRSERRRLIGGFGYLWMERIPNPQPRRSRTAPQRLSKPAPYYRTGYVTGG